MRLCQCGGIILQYTVKAGEAWHCDACGRRDTMIKYHGQVRTHETNQTPYGLAFNGEIRDVSASESQTIRGFCFLVPIANDETMRQKVRAAIERKRTDRPV